MVWSLPFSFCSRDSSDLVRISFLCLHVSVYATRLWGCKCVITCITPEIFTVTRSKCLVAPVSLAAVLSPPLESPYSVWHFSSWKVWSWFFLCHINDWIRYHSNTLQVRFAEVFKRLRKSCPDYPFKYLAIGDYGENTFRPHYHALLIGFPQSWPPLYVRIGLLALWTLMRSVLATLITSSATCKPRPLRKKLSLLT